MKRRGFSLVEVIFTMALSTIVLAGLFLLLRGGTRQFELSSAQVFLGQSTRGAVEDALVFSCSAVSPLVESAQAVYSPAPNCSESDAVFPNVYCLDFASCCDFLDPRFNDQPELTSGYLNRRGGGRFRYRIRYDVASQKLLLERLQPSTPANNPQLDVTAPARVLAINLERVTFSAVGNTVHMTVGAATVKNNGEVQGGLQITDNRRSTNPNDPAQRRARRLQVFTVVTIPSRTTR